MSFMRSGRPIERLRDHLTALPTGRLADESTVLNLLAEAWEAFEGSSDTGMAAYKVARAENMIWLPPVLEFRIERHGRTVNGSTRAELQQWRINVDTGEAQSAVIGLRQLKAVAPPMSVHPIAWELATVIQSRTDHPAIQWSSDRTQLTVMVASLIPDSGPRQTVSRRRRRLRERLDLLILPIGWMPEDKPWTYRFVER